MDCVGFLAIRYLADLAERACELLARDSTDPRRDRLICLQTITHNETIEWRGQRPVIPPTSLLITRHSRRRLHPGQPRVDLLNLRCLLLERAFERFNFLLLLRVG